jgi:septum formation topological specificity factor MinE
MSPIPDVAPKPEAVDLQAIEYARLQKLLADATEAAEAAATPVKNLKLELIELVRKFGGVHREKSKLLHGIVWEMMATFGQSTSQDAAAVERLRLALVKAKKARILKKLFTKQISWRFNSDASEVIKGEKLTPKQMALVLQCFDTEDRTPTLDVREKKKAAAAGA